MSGNVDIVEILRDIAAGRKNSVGDQWGRCWCETAATEIERLRAEVKEQADQIDFLYEEAAGADI